MSLLLFQAPNTTNWQTNLVAWSTLFIAVATGVNLIVAILMWRVTRSYTLTTRDMFEASHRPYIGIAELESKKEENNPFALLAYVKNFGNVPAYNFLGNWQLRINGQLADLAPRTDKPQIIAPQALIHIVIYIGAEDFLAIKDGAQTDLVISLQYEGVTGKRHHCKNVYSYSRELRDFEIIRTEGT